MASERETRSERDFWGNEHQYIYEDGKRVGEYKLEDRGGILGFGDERRNVEYDADGNELGYARQERRGEILGFGGEDVEALYDKNDKRSGYSRVEERGGFLGFGAHHARIGYDEDDDEVSSTQWERRGGFLGFGERQARVTRYADRGGRSRGGSASFSSGGDSSLEDGLVKLVIGLAVVFFVIWLVFQVLLPLAIINTALLALGAAAMSTRRRKMLLIVSIVGAGYVLLDYNSNGLTHSLTKTLPFLLGWMSAFVYLNVAAGLIAAYPLLHPVVVELIPTEEANSSKQHLYLAGSLLLAGGAIVAAQSYVDRQWQKNHPTLSVAPVGIDQGNGSMAGTMPSSVAPPQIAPQPQLDAAPPSTPATSPGSDTPAVVDRRTSANGPDMTSPRRERMAAAPVAPRTIACVLPDGREEKLTAERCESAGGMEYR